MLCDEAHARRHQAPERDNNTVNGARRAFPHVGERGISVRVLWNDDRTEPCAATASHHDERECARQGYSYCHFHGSNTANSLPHCWITSSARRSRESGIV